MDSKPTPTTVIRTVYDRTTGCTVTMPYTWMPEVLAWAAADPSRVCKCGEGHHCSADGYCGY